MSENQQPQNDDSLSLNLQVSTSSNTFPPSIYTIQITNDGYLTITPPDQPSSLLFHSSLQDITLTSSLSSTELLLQSITNSFPDITLSHNNSEILHNFKHQLSLLLNQTHITPICPETLTQPDIYTKHILQVQTFHFIKHIQNCVIESNNNSIISYYTNSNLMSKIEYIIFSYNYINYLLYLLIGVFTIYALLTYSFVLSVCLIAVCYWFISKMIYSNYKLKHITNIKTPIIIKESCCCDSNKIDIDEFITWLKQNKMFSCYYKSYHNNEIMFVNDNVLFVLPFKEDEFGKWKACVYVVIDNEKKGEVIEKEIGLLNEVMVLFKYYNLKRFFSENEEEKVIKGMLFEIDKE
jgi:hypothetical protein